ncbi:MAG: CHASE3 domain-containing protein [Pyrinomonadaceae bacterium]|nr:CHASE3 domain-containing protein [Pyrinomonadaceae bacterium]
MPISLEKKIPLLLLLALLILATAGYFVYRSANSLQEAVKREKQTTEVLVNLDEILISVLDVETGSRGFVLTGNDVFLAHFTDGKQKTVENIGRLETLLADNSDQTAHLAGLKKQFADKIVEVEKHISIRRSQGLAASSDEIAGGEGKVLMDNIRSTIGRMKSEESRLLEIRESNLQNSLSKNFWLMMLGSLAGTALLLLASYIVFFEIRKRREAEIELIEANKELENRVALRTEELKKAVEKASVGELFSRDILNSFSAHVAVLDKNGIIVEVNNAWENFAKSNSTDEELNRTGIGQNYLNVCDGDCGDVNLAKIKTNLTAILIGELKQFTIEYPCHAPDEQRWFLMQVNTLRGENGGAVVSHYNITDRVKAEKESEQLLLSEREARREAEIANRLRDDFMASVSHELRTPLNSILAWARLLESGKLDAEVSSKAMKTIIRNAETQNRLIEDLMDIARIISGKLKLEYENINPRELISSSIETVKPAAEAKSIKLDFSYQKYYEENGGKQTISADPHRLQQIVSNLLTNAIKFTPEGGAIKVGLAREDDHAILKVKDNGAGISREFLPFVFEPYQQDLKHAKQSGGLGLGLSIVRQLTELHGGSVYVESEGENLGTTFTVKLPIA